MMAAILIVDDSATQNACLELLLSRAGHRAVGVESINAARVFCDRNLVDLCLIELLLFKNNGFEIAAELQKINAAPTVLMLSRQLEADVIWAGAQGIKNFLYRPCASEICTNMVVRLLAQNKLPRPDAGNEDTLR